MNEQKMQEMRRAMRDKRDQERIAEKFQEVVESPNGVSREIVVAGLLRGLTRSHRTLQQDFIRALRDTLVAYGECDTDLRNQAAVDWAKQAGDIQTALPRV